MRRYLLLFVIICVFTIQVKAQYVRVNYDKKTIAAMVGATEQRRPAKSTTTSR
jgi:hypothetical protein